MIESVRVMDDTMIVGMNTSRGYFSVSVDGEKVRPEREERKRFAMFTPQESEKIENMAFAMYALTFAGECIQL